MPKRDPTFREIVGGHFDIDLVARQNADAILAHLARGMSKDFVAIVELNPKHGIGENFGNNSFELE